MDSTMDRGMVNAHKRDAVVRNFHSTTRPFWRNGKQHVTSTAGGGAKATVREELSKKDEPE
jgi:hypothetical protein